eukprot:scaffold4170_cov330-Prasinococcus_capsulatus_cf.AAC.1
MAPLPRPPPAPARWGSSPSRPAIRISSNVRGPTRERASPSSLQRQRRRTLHLEEEAHSQVGQAQNALHEVHVGDGRVVRRQLHSSDRHLPPALLWRRDRDELVAVHAVSADTAAAAATAAAVRGGGAGVRRSGRAGCAAVAAAGAAAAPRMRAGGRARAVDAAVAPARGAQRRVHCWRCWRKRRRRPPSPRRARAARLHTSTAAAACF